MCFSYTLAAPDAGSAGAHGFQNQAFGYGFEEAVEFVAGARDFNHIALIGYATT